jgi:hypothetical protein
LNLVAHFPNFFAQILDFATALAGMPGHAAAAHHSTHHAQADNDHHGHEDEAD